MLESHELAQLSRLTQISLNDSAASNHRQRLCTLIQLGSNITSTDATNVEPLISPLEQTQRLRADEVTESDQRELYQSLAPATEDGLYLVPQVLD